MKSNLLAFNPAVENSIMPPARCFGIAVELVAAIWRGETLTRLDWLPAGNPGEVGGQAQGFFVKSGGFTGFAKPTRQPNEVDAPLRAVHEKIASDLAFDLSLPVPPVVLWRRPVSAADQEPLCAISFVPFRPAHKWEHIMATPAARDRIAGSMAVAASAMAVFDTWLDNRDRPNGGNLLAHEGLNGAGNIQWAYIDYAYSMTYGWGAGPVPPIAGAVGRYPPEAAADPAAVAATLNAIESMAEDAIRSVPERLTDHIDAAKRGMIADGLLRRRDGLREAMRQEYGEAL